MSVYEHEKEEKEAKIDFTKKFPDLYEAFEWEVSLIKVPQLSFITSEWVGVESTDDDFYNAFNDVHTFVWWLAFSMKFRLKRMDNAEFSDYHMPPIEAVWQKKGKEKKDRKWKLMLLQPNCISEAMLKKSLAIAKMKKQDQLLPWVILEKIAQWTCMQTLHVWPYTDVQSAIDLIAKEAKSKWYKVIGQHHEIFLNDKRRTSPDKLQTIVRYQVQKI